MALKKPRIATSIWRSQIALRILADMVFWVDRFPRPLRRWGISVWVFDTDLISRARHAANGRGCGESP
jgi:hypothetical protein